MEGEAFRMCESLKSAVLPASLTEIGPMVFGYCDALVSITVDPENPVYHSAGNCVIETETKTLVIGCNTSRIPTDGSVTAIGDEAFGGCGLSEIVLHEGITRLEDTAFFSCENLKSITLPASLRYLGEGVFNECDKLTTIHYSGSMADWEKIEKATNWNYYTTGITAYCSDGEMKVSWIP